MADSDNGFIVTRAGLNVLAKAIAGKLLKFVRVAFGDCEFGGENVTVTDEEAFDLANLIHWRKDLPIIGEPTVSGGVANIKFLVQNADVSEGFWMCETGVFALDPDTNEEVLYAYQYKGMRGGWLPPAGGTEIWQEEIVAAIAVAQAEHITAVIDESLLYVTQAEFQRHIADNKPHPNSPTIGLAVNDTDYIWAVGDDNNLHPFSVEDLARKALGGSTDLIPLMNSRISQTEVNIANLFTQLNAENDLGVKPNLLLTDDFDNPINTDFYRQRVITSVAGISNVRVATNEGIHTGSWYTISDGVNREFVQVSALAKNGDAQVAIFSDDIVNTYDLPNTYLYRTTLSLQNGSGVGAGDTRTETYPFTEVWQGTSAGSSSTVMLNTTLANQNAFTLSGDWAFNSDGEFTLS